MDMDGPPVAPKGRTASVKKPQKTRRTSAGVVAQAETAERDPTGRFWRASSFAQIDSNQNFEAVGVADSFRVVVSPRAASANHPQGPKVR